jgi:hypothetical protein
VVAYSAVTDVPTSVITGDVGLSPAAGSAYQGLTQTEVTGTIYSTNASGPLGDVDNATLLTSVTAAESTAFGDVAAFTPTLSLGAGDNQLGGKTLTAGVYTFGHAPTANITAASPLVLNGQGNPNAVFIFQASSDLVTASGSSVELENGAQACNVFWDVDSSASLKSSSTMVGTVLAADSITFGSNVTVKGRVMAQTGDVTLISDTITVPTTCATTVGSTPPTTTAPGGGGGGSTTGPGSSAGASTSPGVGSGAVTPVATNVIPSGYPHTGLGGASRSHNGWLLLGGATLVGGASLSAGMALRRRRTTARSGDQPVR